jgi:retron-type reverse transcriptase
VFEPDLDDGQYAYRNGRSPEMAIKEIQRLLNRDGHREVVDADLTSYFDTIPHQKLIEALVRRIADKAVIHLIKMWIEAPIVEKDKKTRREKWSTENRDKRIGTPQGSPISPFLSNIYMRQFILRWKRNGLTWLYGSVIVNYADDLVICCKRQGDQAMKAMRIIMADIGLTVNEEKTKLVHMP